SAFFAPPIFQLKSVEGGLSFFSSPFFSLSSLSLSSFLSSSLASPVAAARTISRETIGAVLGTGLGGLAQQPVRATGQPAIRGIDALCLAIPACPRRIMVIPPIDREAGPD